MVEYQIDRRLSNGKFGEVYLVRDRRSGEERALKIINARVTTNGPQPVNPIEVYFMAKVENPCVVRLLDAFVQPFRVAILMEYFPGETLLETSECTSVAIAGDLEDIFSRSRGSLNEVPPLIPRPLGGPVTFRVRTYVRAYFLGPLLDHAAYALGLQG